MLLSTIDKTKTFENFYLEDKYISNTIEYLKELVKNKEFSHSNPFHLTGRGNIGKSHLVNAIANEFNLQFPEKNILFIDGNFFLNNRKKFKTILNEFIFKMDILIIDDLDVLLKHKIYRAIMVKLINYALKTNKLMVYTSRLFFRLFDYADFRENGGFKLVLKEPSKEFIKKLIQQGVKFNKRDSIALYFDLDDFSEDEIAEVLIYLNHLYKEAGGDTIKISEFTLMKGYNKIVPKLDGANKKIIKNERKKRNIKT